MDNLDIIIHEEEEEEGTNIYSVKSEQCPWRGKVSPFGFEQNECKVVCPKYFAKVMTGFESVKNVFLRIIMSRLYMSKVY